MDDGAQTLEDSIALVKMAAAAGTTDLVGTPHASPHYPFEFEVVQERLRAVQAATGGIVRLYSGCDFHLSYDNIQDALEHPRKYTINQNRYLLVEFSDLLIFHNTPDIFARLREAGMSPIVTHPERNALLRQRIDDLAAWCEAGAYLQITAQSLIGRFGRSAQDFSRVLLDRGLVHFVASDGHHVEHRPPTMDAAYAWLEANQGAAVAEALCVSNPRATLTGDSIERPDRDAAAPARRWYQLWR